LTPREVLFCEQYVIDLNATQAAVRAGYSEKTAQEQGSRLLSRVIVANEIQRLMDKRAKKTNITAEYVLNTILKTIDECREGVPVYTKLGDIAGYKPDHANALKGCELLGKHLKLFTDKIDLGGQDGNPLLTRIERVIIDSSIKK